MIYVVWEFRVLPEARQEFLRHYGPEGSWARLFRQAEGYERTLLLADRNAQNRYFTIDVWRDLEAFERFKGAHADAYKALDAQGEELTESEKLVGIFEEIR